MRRRTRATGRAVCLHKSVRLSPSVSLPLSLSPRVSVFATTFVVRVFLFLPLSACLCECLARPGCWLDWKSCVRNSSPPPWFFACACVRLSGCVSVWECVCVSVYASVWLSGWVVVCAYVLTLLLPWLFSVFFEGRYGWCLSSMLFLTFSSLPYSLGCCLCLVVLAGRCMYSPFVFAFFVVVILSFSVFFYVYVNVSSVLPVSPRLVAGCKAYVLTLNPSVRPVLPRLFSLFVPRCVFFLSLLSIIFVYMNFS